LRLAPYGGNAELREDLENASAAAETWRGVIPGDDNCGNTGIAKLGEAAERLDNRAR
jgi:hypothetical protein